MTKILKTTLATAFAAACIAGASVAFAADNGGKNGDNGNNNSDNGGKNTTAGKKSKDNKCANDASGAASTDCTAQPNDAQ